MSSVAEAESPGPQGIDEIATGVASTISQDSDLSEIGEAELDLAAPPQKNALQKQAAKLRSRYEDVRTALLDEQIRALDSHIEQVLSGDHPRMRDALAAVEAKKNERLLKFEERRKIYFSQVENVYRVACQAAIQDYQVGFIDDCAI